MSFEPTHVVGPGAIRTWPSADLSQDPGPELDAGLEVQVVREVGPLSHVVCSNGWEAWIETSGLTPLAAAPTGPPPAPAAPAVPAAPVGQSAPAKRPAWLVPAVAAAVVVVLIAVFALQAGDDGKKGSGGSESLSTAKDGGSKTSSTTTAVVIDLEKAVPSASTLADITGGSWTDPESCEPGGTNCEPVKLFDTLCNDKSLAGATAEDTLYSFYTHDPNGAMWLRTRRYASKADATAALEAVRSAYTGPCQSFEKGDKSHAFTPGVVEKNNFDFVAMIEIVSDGGAEPTFIHHIALQAGFVVFVADITGATDLRDGYIDSLLRTLVRGVNTANVAAISE